MSERLSDVETRIDTVRQLDSVITAMRGMAAARVHEARERVAGIRACAAMIGDAIATALTLDGAAVTPVLPPAGDRIVIALCSEQGFAGTFNERVLDAVAPLLDVDRPQACELLLIGDRGVMVAGERHWPVAWSAPALAHADEAAALADRLTRELYRRLADGRARQVLVVHAQTETEVTLEVRRVQLLPFDFQRFPTTKPGSTERARPLVTLAPTRLLELLAEEYVNAQLCEALVLSFAAENQARMVAMIAARAHVHETLDDLVGRSRRLRQEDITAEIVELSGSRFQPVSAEAATGVN